MFLVKKSAGDALSNVAGLRERVAASDSCYSELLANASAAPGQITRATALLRREQDTISTQSMEVAKIVQLNKRIKNFQENVSFYKASEGDVEEKVARATAESTRLGKLFDHTSA